MRKIFWVCVSMLSQEQKSFHDRKEHFAHTCFSHLILMLSVLMCRMFIIRKIKIVKYHSIILYEFCICFRASCCMLSCYTNTVVHDVHWQWWDLYFEKLLIRMLFGNRLLLVPINEPSSRIVLCNESLLNVYNVLDYYCYNRA